MSEETNSSTPLPSEEENISDSQAFKMYSDYDVVTVAFKRKAMLRAYAKKTVEKKLHPKQLQSLAPSPAYYVKGGKLNFGNASKGNISILSCIPKKTQCSQKRVGIHIFRWILPLTSV